MVQEISGKYITFQEKGSVGHVILNRPESLNALNMEMIRGLSFALSKWQGRDHIKTIFIEGAGDRAFCAGGDIKGFYMAGMDYRKGKINFDVAMLYFKEEYALNKQIFHYPKPIVAFMNGITMGGGYGIAGHCSHRVVCEDTVFAMPETRIGFFPDVGSMAHLTRMPDYSGLYLALSGQSVGTEDMIYAGLADTYIKRTDADSLLDDLANLGGADANKQVDSALEYYARDVDLSRSVIKNKAGYIRSVYAGDRGVAELIERLNAMRPQDVNAAHDYTILSANSPLSLLVTYAYYQKAQNIDFDEIIEQDFLLACNFAKGLDFYEGIRAAVIDKDRKPKWTHSDLGDINQQDIEYYFK